MNDDMIFIFTHYQDCHAWFANNGGHSFQGYNWNKDADFNVAESLKSLKNTFDCYTIWYNGKSIEERGW